MLHTSFARKLSFIYQPATTKFCQRRGCLFYDLGSPQTFPSTSCHCGLWNQISAKTQADLPTLDITESGFPFCHLPSRNKFFSPSLAATAK